MNSNSTELYESCSPEVKYCFDILERAVEELPEYNASDGVIFYALDLVKHDLVDDFLNEAVDSSDSFWRDNYTSDFTYTLWYTTKLLDKHSVENWREIEEVQRWVSLIENGQHRSGRLVGEAGTAGLARFLVLSSQQRGPADQAINYFLNKEKNSSLRNISIGFLAISELDYESYRRHASDLSDLIVEELEGLEYPSEGDDYLNRVGKLTEQCLAIWALSRTDKHNHTIDQWAKRATESGILDSTRPLPDFKERLENSRSELVEKWDGLFDNPSDLTRNMSIERGIRSPARSIAYLTVALSVAGKGPKVPRQRHQWELEQTRQKTNRVQPNFIATIPSSTLSQRETAILDHAEQMIKGATDSLLISTHFIDMLYDEIIDLTSQEECPEIKILARNTIDRGERQKIKSAVLSELVKATEGNVRDTHLLHTRMLIADESELLVSTADLTRDQMVDMYNAGIYTRADKAVQQAVDFFELIWEHSEPINP